MPHGLRVQIPPSARIGKKKGALGKSGAPLYFKPWIYCFFSIFAQVSRSVAMRLNTGAFSEESMGSA